MIRRLIAIVFILCTRVRNLEGPRESGKNGSEGDSSVPGLLKEERHSLGKNIEATRILESNK
jgi:hypothetical protein